MQPLVMHALWYRICQPTRPPGQVSAFQQLQCGSLVSIPAAAHHVRKVMVSLICRV
jgi:hypothetical protein